MLKSKLSKELTMTNNKGLVGILKEGFSLHGARLSFMSSFIKALIIVRTVNMNTLSSALNAEVFPESNEKRLKRFFYQIRLDKTSFGKFMLKLLPEQSHYILSLDRTNWQVGRVSINVLMLAVCYQGIAFPVAWKLLDKRGNSSTRERLDLLDEVLTYLAATKIEAIVADREFIGKTWFKGLKKRKLCFVMRLRNNTVIGSKAKNLIAHKRYGYLKKTETYVCPKRVWIYGLRLNLAVTKSQDGELLVLACNDKPELAFIRYAQRWNIECLFSALKKRGFNFEDTRLTQLNRLDNLIILLSLAFTWAHLMGEWVYKQRPLKIKKHGYLPISLFKRGLNYLRTAILAQPNKPAKFSLDSCLNLLSP
jgi:hypothetical protein